MARTFFHQVAVRQIPKRFLVQDPARRRQPATGFRKFDAHAVLDPHAVLQVTVADSDVFVRKEQSQHPYLFATATCLRLDTEDGTTTEIPVPCKNGFASATGVGPGKKKDEIKSYFVFENLVPLFEKPGTHRIKFALYGRAMSKIMSTTNAFHIDTVVSEDFEVEFVRTEPKLPLTTPLSHELIEAGCKIPCRNPPRQRSKQKKQDTWRVTKKSAKKASQPASNLRPAFFAQNSQDTQNFNNTFLNINMPVEQYPPVNINMPAAQNVPLDMNMPVAQYTPLDVNMPVAQNNVPAFTQYNGVGYFTYPVQPAYSIQPTYPDQPTYAVQPTYPVQPAYNGHLPEFQPTLAPAVTSQGFATNNYLQNDAVFDNQWRLNDFQSGQAFETTESYSEEFFPLQQFQ